MQTQTIKLRYHTVNIARLRGGHTFLTKVFAASAVDANTGATVKRMTTAERMGKWIAANGFEWVFGSNGEWRRVIITR